MGCGSSLDSHQLSQELVLPGGTSAVAIVTPAAPPPEGTKGCKGDAMSSAVGSASNHGSNDDNNNSNNNNDNTNSSRKKQLNGKKEGDCVLRLDTPSADNTPTKAASLTMLPASVVTQTDVVTRKPSGASHSSSSSSSSSDSSGENRSRSRSHCGSDMVIEERSASLEPRILSSPDSAGNERKSSPRNEATQEESWSSTEAQLRSPRRRLTTASVRRLSPRNASPADMDALDSAEEDAGLGDGVEFVQQHEHPDEDKEEIHQAHEALPRVVTVAAEAASKAVACDSAQPLPIHGRGCLSPSPSNDPERGSDFDAMDARPHQGSMNSNNDKNSSMGGQEESGFAKVDAVSTLGSQMSGALDVEDEATTRLATFSSRARTCMKCGSGAIAYVSVPTVVRLAAPAIHTAGGEENSDHNKEADDDDAVLSNDAAAEEEEEEEEEYYMCEACYFADLGAHRMVPLHETRCNTSRTMGSSMASVLTMTEGGASSLFYNPCSVCHRVIDDTEVVHRCEKCDFIVCDNCFTTRAIQHEDELKRFQRRQNESVHETSIVSKTHDSDGNKVINDYTVVRLLGTGSYAKVKLVKHIVTHELFALKILRRQRSAASSLTRSRPLSRHGGEDDLLREVAVMKFVNHPNLVQLKEVIEDVDAMKIYIIMEYCERGPIHVYGEPPLPLELVRRYGCDVLKGLLHLHSEFLYHRDVKPANCLVDGKGVAKLADFGSCTSRIRSNLTEGTLAYSAPEQIRGEEVAGEVVDSWAFAITLYQASFGRLPYPINTIRDIHDAVAGPEPIDIPRHGCDPALADLLGRMLNKDLSHRLLLREAASHAFFDPQRDPQLTTSLLSMGSAVQNELTMQRSMELYYKAVKAVLRGSNLKDCFHGVHSIRRMRRRLRSNHGFHTPLSRHASNTGRGQALGGGFGSVRVMPRQWVSEFSPTEQLTPGGAAGGTGGGGTTGGDSFLASARAAGFASSHGRDAASPLLFPPSSHRRMSGSANNNNNNSSGAGAGGVVVMEDGDEGEDADDEAEAGEAGSSGNNSNRRRPSFTNELDDKVELHNGPQQLPQPQPLMRLIVRRPSDAASAATPVVEAPRYTEAGAGAATTTTAGATVSNGSGVLLARREMMPLVSSLMSHQSTRLRGLGTEAGSLHNVRLAATAMDFEADESGVATDVLRISRVTMSEPPASVRRYAPTAKRLVFAHNGLRSLGAMDFASFALLKDIAIVSNGLTSFPEAVLAAPRLLRLDLSGNHITNVPPSLRRARFLERLDLYNNEIRHVGAVLEPRRVSSPTVEQEEEEEAAAAAAANNNNNTSLLSNSMNSNNNNYNTQDTSLIMNNTSNIHEGSSGAAGKAPSQMAVVSVLAAPCLRHVRLNENPLQALPEALHTTTATSLELVLDANPCLIEQWSALVERGESGAVVVVWDDYFPVRVPHTPCLVWVATSYLNVYHVHTLETCAARHLVLFHAVDRRFPLGALTAAQLAAYFVSSQTSSNETNNVTDQNSFAEERRSNGTSEEMNGSHRGGGGNTVSAAFAARSLSSLPAIVSPEAARYVKSYFFVSQDEEDTAGGYRALYDYLMHILPSGEGVMLFISNTTTVRATREITTAALSAVLKKIAGDTETLRQRFEYVMAAMRSLYE